MTTFQHLFGQAAIDSIKTFSKADIKDVAALQADEFSHVSDAALRRSVAQTMYGSRWLYKLGLGLLVDGIESVAHVRTQVIDYGSICEALLGDCILHGINRNVMVGAGYRTSGNAAINWRNGPRAAKMDKRNFAWRIDVAAEEAIIDPQLRGHLTRLRNLRNTVHITKLATTRQQYYRVLAKSSYTTVHSTIAATKAYKAANP
ncbi:hypothetical protein OIU35_18090 [Boseaceae bacterium BT-24-1]|nr:hypothetical protein [Boseaceae bacterium BT-24-1]